VRGPAVRRALLHPGGCAEMGLAVSFRLSRIALRMQSGKDSALSVNMLSKRRDYGAIVALYSGNMVPFPGGWSDRCTLRSRVKVCHVTRAGMPGAAGDVTRRLARAMSPGVIFRGT
jgi:hypothetical protein